MQNKLKGWLAANTVTEDPKDMILVLDATGNAGLKEIYKEMLDEDTGLREETIIHVTSLFQRVVARFLMNGYNVNTDLFYAVARFTGLIDAGKWDPKANSIYVSFRQDKILREEIANTEVVILTTKPDLMYILETEDRKTGLKDGRMTPGRNFVIRGSFIRVEGTDATVGLTLRKTDTQDVTKLDADLFAVNNPSELIILIPTTLTDGAYELTITTQYMKSKTLLKTPRSVSIPVFVGEGSGGGNDRPDEV